MSGDEIRKGLDNVGWAALKSNHADFAISNGLAKRNMPVSPLAAIADSTDAAFGDLAEIVSKGETIGIDFWQLPEHVPSEWIIEHSFSIIQMVSDGAVRQPEINVKVVDLTASDVPDMMRLVELTKPGPFSVRTIELGRYIGIRQQGQLVAMAGERRRLPGYCEISAVCTHPDHSGKGYARLLTGQLINENWQRGTVPFLGVGSHNTRAFNLYQKLGFHTNGEFQVLIMSH